MKNMTSFGEVLDAADKMSLEEQETLVNILHRRMIDLRRAELTKDIKDANQEFQKDCCRPVTPSEIVQEIES